jgi:N-methylhydantoinase A
MSVRLAVDVGSTFTDVVLYDEITGKVRVSKHTTTPSALHQGVVSAVDEVIGSPDLRSATTFLHATTVGINTLLERSGPLLGLIATAGFRDVLELRRGTRHDARGHRMYDLLWKAPPPLVPRWLRLPVQGRVAPDGAVVTPIELADVRAACEIFREAGVTSIAVALFNAYANASHERQLAAALRDAGFTEVSLSHEASGEISEYERTSTTVVDAYIRPRVAQYLGELQEALCARGFAGTCLVMRSGGGVLPIAEVMRRPVETVMSGPVAGAVAAGHLARAHGNERAVAADIGGTSFDTCLLIQGKPRLLHEAQVLGYPVQIPLVDVRSIGAGGGSIARAEDGLLRVGPQSAGILPGPACYARGGTAPTVTDAAACLGMLADGQLAGGLRLDLDLARQVLAELGRTLGVETDTAAQGVVEVMVASMGSAIRSVSVEVGEDPRSLPLVIYGGAGPLFACHLIRELGMACALVPTHAGNFSATGLLLQEPTRSASQTVLLPLSERALASCNLRLEELFARLSHPSTPALPDDGEMGQLERRAIAVDMRYIGQLNALSIDLPCQPSGAIAAEVGVAEIRAAFEDAYQSQFGVTLDGPVEIVALRATLHTPVPEIVFSSESDLAGSQTGEAPGPIEAYSFTAKRRLDFSVIHREALRPGAVVYGPALLLEPTTTTYIDLGFEALVLTDRTLRMREEGLP